MSEVTKLENQVFGDDWKVYVKCVGSNKKCRGKSADAPQQRLFFSLFSATQRSITSAALHIVCDPLSIPFALHLLFIAIVVLLCICCSVL
jgi:hypothetical protein